MGSRRRPHLVSLKQQPPLANSNAGFLTASLPPPQTKPNKTNKTKQNSPCALPRLRPWAPLLSAGGGSWASPHQCLGSPAPLVCKLRLSAPCRTPGPKAPGSCQPPGAAGLTAHPWAATALWPYPVLDPLSWEWGACQIFESFHLALCII